VREFMFPGLFASFVNIWIVQEATQLMLKAKSIQKLTRNLMKVTYVYNSMSSHHMSDSQFPDNFSAVQKSQEKGAVL
jgi:hypothetical protein